MDEHHTPEPTCQHNNSVSHYTGDADVFASPKVTSCHLPQHSAVVNGDKIVDSISMAPGTFRRGSDGPILTSDPSERSSVYKKLENIRAWSLNTLKCTKQVLEEKLGTAVPTSDEHLDLRIETLRQMQKQYRQLLDYVRLFFTNLEKTIQSQRQLAGHLAILGQQQPELAEEFARNAELQRTIVLHGDKLLCVLDTFCNGLSTLVHHTFDDTMLTIRNMNSARVEFDAYRKEADTIKAAPAKPNQNDPTHNRRAEEAVARFQTCEANFLKLKSAVDAKLRLLHENRVRVMQHNLMLFYSATSAYFSGNMDKLELTLKEFNIKPDYSPKSKSWLPKSLTRSTSVTHSQSNGDHKSPTKHVNGSNNSQPNASCPNSSR